MNNSLKRNILITVVAVVLIFLLYWAFGNYRIIEKENVVNPSNSELQKDFDLSNIPVNKQLGLDPLTESKGPTYPPPGSNN